MREKREYVRSNGLVLVNYRIPDLNLEGKSSAFDISGVGLRITVDKKIKNDTSIEMEIYLPGSSQPIIAKGKIVWAEKWKEYFYTGINFTVIDENNRERIVNYVHRKFHQPKP